MKSFVSKFWVLKEEPTNLKFNVSTEITPNMTLKQVLDEFIETFVLSQESGATNMVRLPFANIYICCKYIEYTTADMSKVFADHGAYEVYVAETMLKLGELLKFENKIISEYICSNYN